MQLQGALPYANLTHKFQCRREWIWIPVTMDADKEAALFLLAMLALSYNSTNRSGFLVYTTCISGYFALIMAPKESTYSSVRFFLSNLFTDTPHLPAMSGIQYNCLNLYSLP